MLDKFLFPDGNDLNRGQSPHHTSTLFTIHASLKFQFIGTINWNLPDGCAADRPQNNEKAGDGSRPRSWLFQNILVAFAVLDATGDPA